ncbi:hypothetical protein BH23THE1_BH23THE1_29850 [soil metagenome]
MNFMVSIQAKLNQTKAIERSLNALSIVLYVTFLKIQSTIPLISKTNIQTI